MQKNCGCKGIRKCIVCGPNFSPYDNCVNYNLYFYCPSIRRVVREYCSYDCNGKHIESYHIDGVNLFEDFITANERKSVLLEIDKHEWIDSQSGRRKQDYGPKVNFKRQKVNGSKFSGLPQYMESIMDRCNQLDCLSDFQPVELCNLEYVKSRGASIDPHYDDSWLWGERLVTLNWCGSVYLSLTVSRDQIESEKSTVSIPLDEGCDGLWIKVPLRPGSLLVLSGSARFLWQHGIKRGEIVGDGRELEDLGVGLKDDDDDDIRIASNIRELSPEFLIGSRKDEGRQLLSIAMSYQGHPVG